MKIASSAVLLLAGLLAGLAGISPTGAEEAPKPPAAALAGFDWLVGSWRVADHDGSFDETWIHADGDTMAAVSRMVSGGKTTLYELSALEVVEGRVVLRVRHFGPGLVVWKSEAEGPQSWPLASLEGSRAVFEDPARPFPRRIVYERLSGEDGAPDRLHARLEGRQGDEDRVVEFRLTRDDRR